MLIDEASSPEHRDTRQRLVVRGGPVHKANSLMQEEADLSDYEPYLCSGIAVADMLARRGVLTGREAREACAALNVREVQWPSEPQIDDGAVLYLDDLAVSHLQHLGIAVQTSSRPKLLRLCRAAKLRKLMRSFPMTRRQAMLSESWSVCGCRLREGLESGNSPIGKGD